MQAIRKTAAILAPVLLGGMLAAGALMAPGASAATPDQITLPLDSSAVNPGGLALDALGWAGSGNSMCPSVTVNAEIGVFPAYRAGCASQWQVIQVVASSANISPPLPVPGTVFGDEIVFTPNGAVATNGGADPNGFCVSTVTDVEHAVARIRPCSATLPATSGASATAQTANQ